MLPDVLDQTSTCGRLRSADSLFVVRLAYLACNAPVSGGIRRCHGAYARDRVLPGAVRDDVASRPVGTPTRGRRRPRLSSQHRRQDIQRPTLCADGEATGCADFRQLHLTALPAGGSRAQHSL